MKVIGIVNSQGEYEGRKYHIIRKNEYMKIL